jgi:hypothetical protein
MNVHSVSGAAVGVVARSAARQDKTLSVIIGVYFLNKYDLLHTFN